MFSSGAILFLMVGSISMIGHFSGAQFVSITDGNCVQIWPILFIKHYLHEVVHFRQPCHRFSDCGITLDQYCHPVLRRCECTPPYEFSYEMNRCSLSPCIRSCKAIGLECVRGDCVLCKVNGKDNCNKCVQKYLRNIFLIFKLRFSLKSNGSHFAYPFWTIVVLCGCIALFLLIVMCFCQSRWWEWILFLIINW